MKKGLAIVSIAFLIFACACGFTSCYKHTYVDSTTVEYTLYEIDDGIYGYYNTVSSKAPAHNYEMITLCINGSIKTFKGTVNINYTEGESKLIWVQKNYIYGDILNVYAPYGSIEIRPNIGMD
jgi:hypothetical protein